MEESIILDPAVLRPVTRDGGTEFRSANRGLPLARFNGAASANWILIATAATEPKASSCVNGTPLRTIIAPDGDCRYLDLVLRPGTPQHDVVRQHQTQRRQPRVYQRHMYPDPTKMVVQIPSIAYGAGSVWVRIIIHAFTNVSFTTPRNLR